MPRRPRAGLSPYLYCDPLRGAPGTEGSFDWTVDVPAKNGIALRNQSLDIAFLSPLDYARESSLYYIVPDIAVSSAEGTGTVTIHFREGMERINALAVDPASASEIVLARVLLAEQFDMRPQLVPYAGELAGALSRVDAALLVGDESVRIRHNDEKILDLVEEWNALTGLPYVHGIWCGRESAINAHEVALLQRLRTEGVGTLDQVAAQAAEHHRLNLLSHQELRGYLETFSFQLDNEAEESMKEFFSYAFYHGILPDVADLQFFTLAEENDDFVES